MTDRDVLERAAEALRKAGEPSDDELARLRDRVLANNVMPLSAKRVSRNVRWLLPLAAAFMAATALAATPGAWEGMLEAAERFLNIELLAPGHKTAGKPRTRRSPEPARNETVAKPVEIATPSEPAAGGGRIQEADARRNALIARENTVEIVRRRPRSLGARAPATSAQRAEPPQEGAAEDAAPTQPSEDLTLYKIAHEKHFRERNDAEALSAWDTYLQRMPAGTFALEAKYNRALCLVRLGRYAEARAALSEFAEGKAPGGYRREEAARFIEALDRRP
jgi:hypothetical protein